MKNKIIIGIYILLGSFSFSANTHFKIWKNNFNAKIVAHTNFYPWIGVGITGDIDYKIFRDDKKEIYFLTGAGSVLNGYKMKEEFSLNGAIYGDARIKGKITNGFHMYLGGRLGLGIQGKNKDFAKITPQLFGGGYLGMEYNNFIVEFGSNTTNLVYLGIGGSF